MTSPQCTLTSGPWYRAYVCGETGTQGVADLRGSFCIIRGRMTDMGDLGTGKQNCQGVAQFVTTLMMAGRWRPLSTRGESIRV